VPVLATEREGCAKDWEPYESSAAESGLVVAAAAVLLREALGAEATPRVLLDDAMGAAARVEGV
jgi:hypothetical protein